MTSIGTETGLEPQRSDLHDIEEYLSVAHTENAVIAKYGIQILELLESDERFLRTENKLGWGKWILRDAFVRRLRLRSPGFIKFNNFLQQYGQEAFEVVSGDAGFVIDHGSNFIEVLPIDMLIAVKAIVNDHYRHELRARLPFEVEIRQGQNGKNGIVVMIFPDEKDTGRFIGRGGSRVNSLPSRIVSEIGVNARVVIVRRDQRNL